MSETKFTPGPWFVGYSDGSGASDEDGYCIVRDGEPVVRSADSFGILYGIEKRADAYLIAAAPDLYAALIDMLDDGDATDRESAMRALRKARGEP
jgi:hypothetical protein